MARFEDMVSFNEKTGKMQADMSKISEYYYVPDANDDDDGDDDDDYIYDDDDYDVSYNSCQRMLA